MSEDDDEGLTEAVLNSDLPVDEPFLNELVNASDPDQSDDDEGKFIPVFYKNFVKFHEKIFKHYFSKQN